jgi:O-antigen ligase
LPGFTLLKVLSLFLLFLYAMSGVRLVLQDRDRFFRGLLLVCEINAYLTVIAYLVLHFEIWGNMNSLGAIEGVVAVPLLLWGTLVASERKVKLRRGIACALALYLVYFSVARAAMLACTISMLVLLVGLRQQRLIVRGTIAITCLIAITAIAAPRRLEEWKRSIKGDVIYKGHFEQGLLGSRMTPWEETTKVIKESPLFGSGFGTSISGAKSFGEVANFRSNAATNREHGSSYLTITEWVGLLGILPFAFLLFLVTRAIVKVFAWIRQTGSASHFAVPLMLVLVSGLVHAFFEDWLFAAGFYLTVLFWSFAFLLVDLLPEMMVYRTRLVHGMRFRYPATTVAVRH